MNKTLRLTILGITIFLFSALSLKLNAAQPQPKLPNLDEIKEEFQKIFPDQEAQEIFNEFYTKLEQAQPQEISKLTSETVLNLSSFKINFAALENLRKNPIYRDHIKQLVEETIAEQQFERSIRHTAFRPKIDIPIIVIVCLLAFLLSHILHN